MGQENIKLNGGIKPMKRENPTNGTRAKLQNMSYGQTLASKEHCNEGDHGDGRERHGGVGLDMGQDREGAHGGTGSLGKK